MILYRDDGSLSGKYLAHEHCRVQLMVWSPERAAEVILHFFLISLNLGMNY